MYSQRELKKSVKEQLRGNYWSLIGVIFVSSLLSGIFPTITWLISGTLAFGVSVYALNIAQHKEHSFGDLFSGFNVFFKTLFLSLLIGLITTVGLCLLIIPGILASLYLSQAYYILAEDNDKTVLQCLSESYQMMKGNCIKYISLSFSYLWFYVVLVLSPVPFIFQDIIVYNSFAVLFYLLMQMVLVFFVVSIVFFLFTAPRFHLAMANFYLYVRGNQVYTENNNYNNYNNYNSYNQ